MGDHRGAAEVAEGRGGRHTVQALCVPLRPPRLCGISSRTEPVRSTHRLISPLGMSHFTSTRKPHRPRRRGHAGEGKNSQRKETWFHRFLGFIWLISKGMAAHPCRFHPFSGSIMRRLTCFPKIRQLGNIAHGPRSGDRNPSGERPQKSTGKVLRRLAEKPTKSERNADPQFVAAGPHDCLGPGICEICSVEPI